MIFLECATKQNDSIKLKSTPALHQVMTHTSRFRVVEAFVSNVCPLNRCLTPAPLQRLRVAMQYDSAVRIT